MHYLTVGQSDRQEVSQSDNGQTVRQIARPSARDRLSIFKPVRQQSVSESVSESVSQSVGQSASK